MGTMAMADTPIGEITPELLAGRLQFAFDNWLAGRSLLFTSVITPEKAEKFQADREAAVGEFYANEDHGYAHSCAVHDRLKEIAWQSPKMIRLIMNQEDLTIEQVGWVFTWSAMFHDLMRFFGYGTPDHEEPAAELARSAFWKDSGIEVPVIRAVVCHDYFCPMSDGEELPLLFLKSPLAEIFRLADKTSLPPVKEVDRWYEYGKRYGQKFFNPDLPDEVRFDLQHNYERRDQITFLLVFFAVQPSDFYTREAAEIYQQWAAGKTEALCRIMAICREEGASERAVMEVIVRFHKRYRLPLPEGVEGLRIYQELGKGKN